MMVTIDVWSVLQTVGIWLTAVMVTLGVAYAVSKSQRWGAPLTGVLLALAAVGVATLLQVVLVRLS